MPNRKASIYTSGRSPQCPGAPQRRADAAHDAAPGGSVRNRRRRLRGRALSAAAQRVHEAVLSPRQRRRGQPSRPSRGLQRQTCLPNAGHKPERQLPWRDPPCASPVNHTPQYSSYPHLRYEGAEPRAATTLMPGRCQHRGAHGGTQRGKRSTEAQSRRYSLWQARRRAQRQDYRQWKAQQKDSALRPPPIHLKPTTQQRLQSRLKSSQSLTTIAPINHTRDAGSKISLPLPTGTPLHLMTWNVEGLRETAKYDLILKFCIKHKVSLLCAQETKSTSSYVSQAGKFYYRVTRRKSTME